MASIVGIATVLSLIAPMITTVMADSADKNPVSVEELSQEDNAFGHLTPEEHMILFGDYPISLGGYDPVSKE